MTLIVDLTAVLLWPCLKDLNDADESSSSRVLFCWTVENAQFETVIFTLAVISFVFHLAL